MSSYFVSNLSIHSFSFHNDIAFPNKAECCYHFWLKAGILMIILRLWHMTFLLSDAFAVWMVLNAIFRTLT